ncbi:MAG: hypothetical protein Q9163_003849 [Psora crenata]
MKVSTFDLPSSPGFCVAGGGAYYFAKRSVNADRAARHEEDLKRQRLKQSLEAEYNSRSLPPRENHHRKSHDHAGSPSSEATHDPAPGGPTAPVNPHDNRLLEDKYLAKSPYRAKKGDRFS